MPTAEVRRAVSRSVLVTGGNRGIGLAIARRLAAGGDQVTVTSRSGDPVAGLATVACDVPNAGITHDQLLALMKEDDFTDVIDTNLAGAYRVAKRAVRGMMKMRRGRMVFISSVGGLLGSGGHGNHAASQ